jgi:hypothetical protein
MRQAVFELRRARHSNERIARSLGISHPTLIKHFAAELERANDAFLAELLRSMWRAANRGNVSAMIWLLKRTSRARAEAANTSATRPRKRA